MDQTTKLTALDEFLCDYTVLLPIITAIVEARAREGSEVPVEVIFPQQPSPVDETFEAELIAFPVIIRMAGCANGCIMFRISEANLVADFFAWFGDHSAATMMDEFLRLRPQIEARAVESIQRKIADEEQRVQHELEEERRLESELPDCRDGPSMIIRVLSFVLRVEPYGERELIEPSGSLSQEQVEQSAIFSMAHEAALTGVEQTIDRLRVLPPDDAGVCAVFMGNCRLSVDHDATQPYCT